MKSKNTRLREIDFLRGLAIILVLLRHQFLTQYTSNMGWIGVDLFFVLSGFLVSGLLFKEYLKYGNIKPGRFLIRRGFKIYPIYYLFYIAYLVPILAAGTLNKIGFFSDMTFTQNYIWGFGYAYPASWSLAVEEHFYFGITLFFWYALNKNKLKLKVADNHSGPSQMEIIIVSAMAICIALRFITNKFLHTNTTQNITMTHLRIDSLLMGVLIGYLYYFRIERLKRFFTKYKLLLYFIAVLCVIWTPFVNYFQSFFAITAGFTLLYISFGILLLSFLLNNNINHTLNRLFSRPVVDVVSKIGFCSYSIYIIHTFIINVFANFITSHHIACNNLSAFIIVSFLSILAGMFMTYFIEKYFLRIRDKFYPNRANQT